MSTSLLSVPRARQVRHPDVSRVFTKVVSLERDTVACPADSRKGRRRARHRDGMTSAFALVTIRVMRGGRV
jgi:hypothetical protein